MRPRRPEVLTCEDARTIPTTMPDTNAPMWHLARARIAVRPVPYQLGYAPGKQRQVRERAVGPVGEDLLGLGVATSMLSTPAIILASRHGTFTCAFTPHGRLIRTCPATSLSRPASWATAAGGTGSGITRRE